MTMNEWEAHYLAELTLYMRRMGMQPHLTGYRYLRTAVYYAMQEPYYKPALMYENVARYYGTSPENAERNIRNLIYMAHTRAPELFHAIFPNYTDRPPNSAVITWLELALRKWDVRHRNRNLRVK